MLYEKHELHQQQRLLLQEQLDLFDLNSLRAKRVSQFNPEFVGKTVESKNGQSICAIDIGGDKIEVGTFVVNNDVLSALGETGLFKAENGVGYLSFLESIAESLEDKPLPVGISTTGVIGGTILKDSSNAPEFTQDFREKYAGNFASLFPSLKSVQNDSVAGIIAGSVEAKYRYPQAKQFLFIVNGSGIGAAVLKDDMIWTAEPGHIKVVDELNIHGQQKTCRGPCEGKGVCLKWIAASGAGIEDIWYQQTGTSLDGHQISIMYQKGNRLANELYDNSARLVAHVIYGLIKVFTILQDLDGTIIICHGGCFKVPGYGQKIHDILNMNTGVKIKMIYTDEFINNACLFGAALSALF